MLNPYFSVIIPAYNASGFICNSLDSVRLQDFNDYEIIVINDGSEDNTLQIVKEYFNQHLELKYKVINQENAGIGGARNAGIKDATGEFIAFLDADDIWFPNKLREIYDYLMKRKDVDLVCHDEYGKGRGKDLIKVIAGPYTTSREMLFKGNSIYTTATVVRRKAVLKIGGFSEKMEFNSVEDYELFLRLANVCKISYYHKFLAEHNYENSITKDVAMHVKNAVNVIEYHYRELKNKSFVDIIRFRIRKANLLRGGGRLFLQLGDVLNAKMYFKEAIILNPFSMKNLYCCLQAVFKWGKDFN